MSIFSTLPDIMVSSTTYISYISYFRQIQADLLLRDREDQQSSGEYFTYPGTHNPSFHWTMSFAVLLEMEWVSEWVLRLTLASVISGTVWLRCDSFGKWSDLNKHPTKIGFSYTEIYSNYQLLWCRFFTQYLNYLIMDTWSWIWVNSQINWWILQLLASSVV